MGVLEPWSIDQPHAQGIITRFNIMQMSELGVNSALLK